MYKSGLFALTIIIIYTFISNIHGDYPSLVTLFLLIFIFTIIFGKIFKPNLNYFQRFGYGCIAVFIAIIIAFLILIIDKDLFNYYLDLTKFKILYNP
jgi:hypothetical protein